MKGEANKQIAEKLNAPETSMEGQRRRIMEIFEVNGVINLLKLVISYKLLN